MKLAFIDLYDDNGHRYIVNIDKIIIASVDDNKVWTGEKSALRICDSSMERLINRLRLCGGRG